eukprot:gene46760-57263_t
MNQARQKAVLQEANMTLVGIRAAELDYFSTFYSNFAIQAALLIGCIANSFSQVPGVDNPSDAPYFWCVVYWISTAITVSSAVHSLICSTFLQVFGQGYGLRGPIGSMVLAIDGMVIEQQNILRSFTISIFAFGVNCFSMFWIMMDSENAIACTILTIIGMILWYRYALRLYNRFSWKSMRTDWDNDDRNRAKDLEDLDPSIVNKMHQDASSGKAKRESKKD